MPGDNKGSRPQGRLFYFLDLLMDGRTTKEQRKRVEDLNARLRLRPGGAMNEIIAVYELYLAELARELAGVSRHVRRGMMVACGVTLFTCATVLVPTFLVLRSNNDAVKLAVSSRAAACTAGGSDFCEGVEAIAQDPAKVFLTRVIARMPSNEAKTLAELQASVNVLAALGQLSGEDLKAVATWAAQRLRSKP